MQIYWSSKIKKPTSYWETLKPSNTLIENSKLISGWYSAIRYIYNQ
jgi:hypothetical protein